MLEIQVPAWIMHKYHIHNFEKMWPSIWAFTKNCPIEPGFPLAYMPLP